MPKRKERILSLSYGKDSLACLGAIEQLGWPLDRIVHAEVWATDTIPADFPPMVEFKKKADKIILERWGIEVEHICAVKGGEKLTYERMFYTRLSRGKFIGATRGFPLTRKSQSWCKHLKLRALQQNKVSIAPGNSKPPLSASPARGTDKNIVQYLGIAADEPERIVRHTKPGFKMPLVEIGWDEAYCRKWCEKNDLLSPIYTTTTRGGCWFCHNQGVDQLRLLRRDYPELWALLLKWDVDSPVTFKSNRRTVHDYEIRFQLEDDGEAPIGHKFRWNMIEGED